MQERAEYTIEPTTGNMASILDLGDDALFTPIALQQALALLEDKAGGLVGDVSTEDGRRAINSMSRSVGGAIARFDDRRRAFVADLKARPAAIDKLFRDTFKRPAEEIQARIKAPLDAWAAEQREMDEETGRIIADLSAPIHSGICATEIAERLETARGIIIPDWLRPDQCDAIAAARDDSIKRLSDAHASAIKAEAQFAELTALRVQAAERERQDREAQIAREAAERATREAEAKVQEEREAAERARQDAERRAREAEERQRQAEAESSRRAEAAEMAERERARVAKMQEEADARKRAADREHAAAINRDVLTDLVALGLSEELGRAVVCAVAKGRVRNMAISY